MNSDHLTKQVYLVKNWRGKKKNKRKTNILKQSYIQKGEALLISPPLVTNLAPFGGKGGVPGFDRYCPHFRETWLGWDAARSPRSLAPLILPLLPGHSERAACFAHATRLHWRFPLQALAAAAPESRRKQRLGCQHHWIPGQVNVLILSICSCWLFIFMWGVAGPPL